MPLAMAIVVPSEARWDRRSGMIVDRSCDFVNLLFASR